MFNRNPQPGEFFNEYGELENEMNPLKTDRRTWNKSNKDLCLEYPDYAGDVQNRSTESNKKYEDHLFNLHLNNQLLKLASRKDKETEQKEKLEGGFSLYMNGAHKKEKMQLRHTVVKNSRKKHMFNFCPNLMPSPNDLEALRAMNQQQASGSSSNPASDRGRKKWNSNMSSITIKTQDGASIKLKPNSSESTGETPRQSDDSRGSQSNEFMQFDPNHYSYDFESDDSSEPEEEEIPDETSITKSSEVIKSLIEDVKFSDESDLEDDDDDDLGGTLKPTASSKQANTTTKASEKSNKSKQVDESEDFS